MRSLTLPRRWRAMCLVLVVAMTGCASTVPYVGQGPHPQFERGHPVLLVDTLGNVLALPAKFLLWNRRFANHAISPETEERMVEFSDRHQATIEQTRVQLNEYAPHHDLKRLIRNHRVAWPYRLLLGLPITLVGDILLPGRVFPWGDYYNPWTNTVHMYSNHPAIGLHELGHAYDTSKRRYQGTYAFGRLIPFVDVYQEWQASDVAIDYLIETQDREDELAAYKILYPAYGTYLGSYLPFFGTLIGLVAGHVWGRTTAWHRARWYRRLDAAQTPPKASTAAP